MATPLVELQDRVLDFLLRYRAEQETDLKFVLRKSNAGGALEAGNWFLTGPDYLALNFWSGPFYFAFRIYESGESGLYEVRTVKVNAKQKQAFDKILPSGKADKSSGNYKIKLFSSLGEDPLPALQNFLENERRLIDNAVRQNPVQEHDPETGEVKGLGMIDDTEFSIAMKVIEEFRQRRAAQRTVLPELKPKKPSAQQPLIALESFILRNFLGIKKAEIFGLPRVKWIFLTGNNGYGKSSILRGIFVGLYGRQDMDTTLADETADLSVRYWNNERVTLNINTTVAEPLRLLAAYGSSRLNISNDEAKNEISRRTKTSYNLFHSDGVLLSVENELRTWYFDDKPRYESVVTTLKNLMPGIADIFYDPSSRNVLYRERAIEGKQILPPLDFEKLASGFRSIIAIVGDMIIRFFQADKSLKKPEECSGIVLIDELDLHLHPIWQRQLPELLSKAFPKIQFIVSTHSPIPFLGAPSDSVFLRVNRSVEEGITVERLDIDISTLLPNTILTSPIFGLQEIFPDSFDDKKQRIRTEDTFDEKKFNDIVKERLTTFSGSKREKDLAGVFTSRTR